MRRIIGWHTRNLFCTAKSVENVKQTIETSPEFVDNYKKALRFRSENKFQQANQCLSNILQIVKKEELVSTNLMLEIMRKQVTNYNSMYQYAESQKTLQQIVKIVMEKQTSPLLLYGAYESLVNHCLRTNLTRGVKLAKALLSGRQKMDLPMSHKKIFTLYLGTGYLLLSNYKDAKSRLEECLGDNPTDNIKACALNNLGVACWWHKYPRFTEPNSTADSDLNRQQSNKQQFQQTDRDFGNTLNYFKQSIENFEGANNLIPGDQKNNLQKLLKLNTSEFIQEHYSEDQLLVKKNKQSGVPLLNITEFLLMTHYSKVQTMFWMKQSALFYDTVDPANNHRSLLMLAVLESAQGNFKEAEKLLKKVIEDLEETDSYLLVIAIELYTKLLFNKDSTRVKQAQQLHNQAESIAKSLPAWSAKLPYINLPKLTF